MYMCVYIYIYVYIGIQVKVQPSFGLRALLPAASQGKVSNTNNNVN